MRLSVRVDRVMYLLALAALLSILSGCDAGRGSAVSAAAPALSAARDGAAASTASSPAAASSGAQATRIAQGDAGDAVTLPASIVRGLQTDQRVLDCAAGTRDGVSQFASDWVGVRRVDLDGDGRADWILNGRHACLRPEGTAAWWVYADLGDGPRQILAGQPAVELQVVETRSGAFRDLRATDRSGHTTLLHYVGDAYVATAATAATSAPAAGAAATGDILDTVAGRLEIVPARQGLADRYTIELAGKPLLMTGQGAGARFAGFPKPTILRNVTAGVPPYDQVIVFQQQMWGNACDGGPLWMLGLTRDGRHAISAAIDFCGGSAPKVENVDGELRITVPGGPATRGDGSVPAETWRYRDGKVTRVGDGAAPR